MPGLSYRSGAQFGPAAIRAGSKLLRPYHPFLDVEPWAVHQVADAGDVACNPFEIREAIGQIQAAAETVLERARWLVSLGGDHTVALPLLRTLSARHGPIALVHFDAHLDTWDTYFGAPYTHGTPFRRASEKDFLALDSSAYVGVRGRSTPPPILRTIERSASRSSRRSTSLGAASTRPSSRYGSAWATCQSTPASTSTSTSSTCACPSHGHAGTGRPDDP